MSWIHDRSIKFACAATDILLTQTPRRSLDLRTHVSIICGILSSRVKGLEVDMLPTVALIDTKTIIGWAGEVQGEVEQGCKGRWRMEGSFWFLITWKAECDTSDNKTGQWPQPTVTAVEFESGEHLLLHVKNTCLVIGWWDGWLVIGWWLAYTHTS